VQDAFGRFFAEVERLQHEVERDGSVLAVLVFPFRGQVSQGSPTPRVQEEIASFCRARGLPFLDLRPPLLELGEAAFSDHVHLTAEGTARVADAIAESGLIPTGEPSDPALPDPAVGASVPELSRALTDPTPRVRRTACWTLGGFGAAAAPALPGLVAALDDPDPGVRAGAAWALGKVGTAARECAAGPLIQRLADANANVRRRAGDALVRVGAECDSWWR
jgi:HEAT repeat protein